MKKIIALMCAAMFLFGGTYALASTTTVSEPQKKEKKMEKKGDNSEQSKK